VIGTIELNVGLDHILGDKCFDTQEKSIPHRKNQFHTIKFKKHTIKFKNTQTGNAIKTKGLG
jgi:hypothetical protein